MGPNHRHSEKSIEGISEVGQSLPLLRFPWRGFRFSSGPTRLFAKRVCGYRLQLAKANEACFMTSNSNLSTDDENDNSREKESHICAVCLDVFFNPYMCYPCHHIFCEPCLRTLAKDNPSSTPCPLCRTTITKVLFQTALNKSTIAFFPNEYFKRKHSFQRTSCARWPLPCCEKVFRVFGGGFSRLRDPFTRRQFPHSTHRLDSTDFEDNSHWWRFDVDVLIIYIFSVNWRSDGRSTGGPAGNCTQFCLLLREPTAEQENPILGDNPLPSLPSSLQAELDLPLLEEKVGEAISVLQSGKSAGADGYPVEYYKQFHLHLVSPLVNAYEEVLCCGSFALVQDCATIVVIPKDNLPRDQC
ncbi:hypothetical protein NDU88_005012 [Pleurodeles waltl]|uniref:RING-type domain-containing protein n=1 Tax=Pleurodeles waltl TaxID=8319 RepID=A0AAV7W8F5_PLEWA|nr:hypothetical protein NDU88_005012 [Pleurodeles waltl]